MIRWMNWMGYDAFTPGVKDFDQGKENLTQLAAIANFPFLSANMDGLNGTLPYLIKDLNGSKNLYKSIIAFVIILFPGLISAR